MGVAVGPGVGVTWVLQPASKATRTRSDKTYLLIFFTSLREDTIPRGCMSMGWFESVALVLPVIYTRLVRERLSPGGLRGLQTR
jgi:hypothetical protein